MSGEHAGFIFTAYGIAIFVVGAMIASIIADHRALKKSLANLPAREGEGEA